MKKTDLSGNWFSLALRKMFFTLPGKNQKDNYSIFKNKGYAMFICIFLLLNLTHVFGQNVTQSNFISVVTPQYMSNGTATRLPVMFRATVSGLTANTTYRYFVQGVTNSAANGGTVDFGGANSGAGNPLLMNSSGTIYTYSTGASLTSAGNFETFTSDASGNYTGWFGFVNTGNGRFNAGNLVYPCITIGNGATGSPVLFRRALDVSIIPLAYSTSAGATNGTFLQENSSSATQKNLAVIYDNVSGTGRPLYVSPIENTGATIASATPGYTTTSGGWNAIIPNNNANGVRRIEQRNVITGNIVGCAATDADGIWTTGSVNTVNPTGGTTAKVISSTDASLDPSFVFPTVSTPTSNSPICAGSALTLSASATGVPAVTYSWTGTGTYSPSNTVSNPSVSGASTGSYSVTVTNVCGSSSGSVSVTVNSLPVVTAGNVSGCTGSPIALSGTPAGGTYSVANPYTGPATTYTHTFTDGNGCTNTSSSANITVNPLPTALCSATNVSCFGGNNGTASVTPSGGTSPYTYLWNTTSGTATVSLPASKDNCILSASPANSNGISSALAVGRDGAGDTTRALIAFDLSSIPPGSVITGVTLTMNLSASAPTAGPQSIELHRLLQDWGEGTSYAGNAPGAGAAASANDATWLKRFFGAAFPWTNRGGDFTAGASASTIVNTPNNLYSWSSAGMVSDVQNWISTPSSNFGWLIKGVESAPSQGKRFDSKDNANMASQPVLVITYATTQTVTGLQAGTYNVVVTDASGCSASCSSTVTQPTAISISSTSVNVSCIGGSDGSATAIASGGTSPYSFSWNTSPVQTNATAVGLVAGSYTVNITSALGCTATSSVVITSSPDVVNPTIYLQSGAMLPGITGPSTLQTPFLQPTKTGVQFTSILSANESIGGYKMSGIPDGLGAFDNGNGTFTLLMNHEFGNTVGVTRAHGSIGAFVSKWVINKNNLSVVSGSDLIQTVYLWNGTSFATGTTAFGRFCSADLPAISAFYNSTTGKGTTERIFMNGEESGVDGRAVGHIATGPNAGTSYQLPWLGKFAWENVVACPSSGDTTLVAGMDDGTGGQVYFYIGSKTTTGTEIDKAGLNNGKQYGVKVNGFSTERVNASTINPPPAPNTPFSLIDLGVVTNLTGTQLNNNSNTAGITSFSRPEDGSWDPSNPDDFYFATTDQLDQVNDGVGTQVGRSRIWRLRFTDVTSPQLGGTITAVLDGTEGHNMVDNLAIDNFGHIILQEDVGNAAHNGKVWQYTIATDQLTLVGKHDQSRFGNIGVPATAPYNQDEETSGVIDASSILGPGMFLSVDQAHSTTGMPSDVIENGQLFAFFNPESFGTGTAKDTVKAYTNTGCTATGIDLGTPATADNCNVASVTNNAPVAFPVGTTNVIWTVTDGAGNTATATQVVIVADTTKPVITCPSNITTCNPVVAFSVTATDNCSVGSIVNTPASGSTFPLGITTVNSVATDVNGNTSTCSFTVDVQSPPTAGITSSTTVLNCTTTSISLTATGGGTYVWDDNSTNAIRTVSTAGTYTVTVTSALGCTATSSVVITSSPDVVNPTIYLQSGAMLPGITGPSTLQTPFLQPTKTGVQFTSILSANESIGGYKMSGIPDGLGAFDNGNGTFTLLMNHEFGNTVGVTRAHGSIGAFVSKWVINKNNLSVVSGSDLIQTVYLWNGTSFATGTTAFGRFCSADLPAISAFYNSTTGKGTTERIFMNGEESGVDGRAVGHIATGPNAGTSYQLPWLGKFAWENVVACPSSGDTTLVAGMDDGTGGQVYFYIGSKTTTGTEIDKAGLNNGKQYGVKVNGFSTERVNASTINPPPAPNTPFSLIDLGVVTNLTGTQLNNNSNTAGITSFSRPEDGSWDPSNPDDFYFATTDQLDQVNDGVGTQVGRSRIWRLRFTDVTSPQLGGTITAVLDGTEGHNMVDNLAIDNFGHIILQEDVGNAAHNGKVWQYTIATDQLTLVGKHDQSRFGNIGVPATAPYNQDEETSGVIDASSILGPGMFLSVDQAHSTTGMPSDVIENGQLFAFFNPESFGTGTAKDTVKAYTNTGCTATGIDLGTPATADNCNVASVTNNAPVAFPVGTTNVIWTVTDGAGNTATATQVVIVADTTKPVITCPGTTNVSTDAGLCTASIGTPVVTDDCGVASMIANPAGPYTVGTTIVTWTATDVNGNIATCSQTVTVTDNENPVVTCPATANINTDAGLCTSNAGTGTSTATDNCSVASVVASPAGPYGVGTHTITWTATDVNGNTATCSQTLNVTDNENPVITCPSNITTCNPVVTFTVGSTDNCSILSVLSTPASGSTFPLGTTTVNSVATDVNGNTSTCSFTVIVSTPSTAPTSVTTDAANNNICLGNNVNLTQVGGSLGTGASYQWYSGSCGGTLVGTGASISVTPTATTTYFVRAEGGCGNTACASVTVTVSTSPVTSLALMPFTGMPVNVCAGTVATLSIAPVNKATYYVWDVPTGSYFNGNPLNISPFTTTTPSVTVTFGAPSGSLYNVGVQAGNACGTSVRQSQKVRGLTSVPTSISGPLTACANSVVTYSTATVTGATSYLWTVTGNATVSGTGTTATVSFGAGYTGGTVCVAAQTTCYTSPAKCITISTAASTLAALSGTFTACPNSTLTYSVPASTGAASYTWTLPSGATGSSSTNSINVTFGPGYSAVGSICVSVTSTCGVTSAQKCKTVAPGLPSQPNSIAGSTNGLCGQSVVYTCPSQGPGVTYTWTVPSGASIVTGQGTTSVNVQYGTFTTGNVCVTANNSCGSSTGRCIGVKGAPATPGSITATPSSWCANTSGIEFNVNVAGLTGAYTLNWTYPTAPVATYALGGGNSTSLLMDWISGTGNINVIASNACGSGTKTSTWSSTCREGAVASVSNITVIPNPTTGIVNINYKATKGNTVINVLDLTGRVVMTQATTSVDGTNNTRLDMSKIAKGVYMLSVQSTQGDKQVRVVVE